MTLHWAGNDYFASLITNDKRAHAALEMLVDDLHASKEQTISRFLCHSGSEDFLWSLTRLLRNNNSRVAGNAAYILGTLAESELGNCRVMALTSGENPDGRKILSDLTDMLTFDDDESVMNAAGTMGTLAESHIGRAWMMREPCLEKTIMCVTNLLTNTNLWTASNAALVLARLTISEEGCENILKHQNSEDILCKLIASLGVDEAGRGMNSAFAIGRLCDLETGRCRLLKLPDSERMISALAKMLCCTDAGSSKNACFALSCLASSSDGHRRLLKNYYIEDVLKMLSELLSSEDGETGWFAAMTLRTLASQPKGCLKLRENTSIPQALKATNARTDLNTDLQEEVLQTLDLLKRLEKSKPPSVTVSGSDQAEITWDDVTTRSGLQVRHQLFEGGQCVYYGKDVKFTMKNLKPYTQYSFRLRQVTDGDESPLSEAVVMTTEETVPGPPANLRLCGATATQLKVGWDPPEEPNGIIKSYYIYNGDKGFEHTQDTVSIITGLQPSTSYTIAVCAATAKGKGAKVMVTGSTADIGAHAPSKPDVVVRGRNELHSSWKPPEVPLGKITRYELSMNNDVIYSGMALHYVARRLKPDKEYTFTVSAITNEGKCESKPTKKRTAKDEYEGERQPLYQVPAKKDDERKDSLKSSPKKKSPQVPHDAYVKPVSRSSSATSIKTRLSILLKDDQVHREPHISYKIAYTNYERSGREVRSPTILDAPDSRPSSHIKLSNADNLPVLNDYNLRKPEPLERTKSQLIAVPAWQLTLRSYTMDEMQNYQRIASCTSAKTTKSEELPRSTQSSAPVRIARTPDPNHPRQDGGKILPKPKPIELNNRLINRSVDGTGSARFPVRKHLPGKPDPGGGETAQDALLQHRHATANVRKKLRFKESGDRARDDCRVRPGHKGTRLKSSLKSTVCSDTADDYIQNYMERERTEMPKISHSSFYTSTMKGEETYDPAASQSSQRDGYVVLQSPLSEPSRGNPAHHKLHRSHTFAAGHRHGTARHLDRLNSSKEMISLGHSAPPHQWKPDFPTTQLHNNRKFVPMQFRTQPANLPRQTTSIGLTENKGTVNFTIDGTGRSKTQLAFPTSGSHSVRSGQSDTSLSHATSTSHSLYKDASKSNRQTGATASVTIAREASSSPGTHETTQVMDPMGFNTVTAEAKTQRAS